VKTALQEHIEWLEDTLSLAKEHAPILENCLKLCISDAKHRLEKEKQQLYSFYMQGGVDAIMEADRSVEDYYNETYEQ
jgi:hypothetical protein